MAMRGQEQDPATTRRKRVHPCTLHMPRARAPPPLDIFKSSQDENSFYCKLCDDGKWVKDWRTHIKAGKHVANARLARERERALQADPVYDDAAPASFSHDSDGGMHVDFEPRRPDMRPTLPSVDTASVMAHLAAAQAELDKAYPESVEDYRARAERATVGLVTDLSWLRLGAAADEQDDMGLALLADSLRGKPCILSLSTPDCFTSTARSDRTPGAGVRTAYRR